MTDLSSATYLRPCTSDDDVFLHDVFSTTWESEVAALPNQKLARHVLRIQHIAQERRFGTHFPGHQRYVVMEDGERAGRLYVDLQEGTLRIVDLTLLPAYRACGLGVRILRDLCALAAVEGRSVTLAIGRDSTALTDYCVGLGFRLTGIDDLEHHFEWTAKKETEAPAAVASPRRPRRNADCL